MTAPTPSPGRRPRSGALAVGVGIFVSRISGIVREAVKASYFGATGSIAADAFTAAFRIPNMLQNMLGEGALSAAFIPVYSRALAGKDEREAGRLAGAVAGMLALVIAVAVALGVLLAPQIVRLINSGFTGERYALTVQLTRIFFPGAGLFVFSAWCLGILNSHKRFTLSYLAPVAWNLAIIAALLAFGPRSELAPLARIAAFASVIGAALQLVVQLPTVLRLVPWLRIGLGRGMPGARTVLKNFAPVALGRGVVQVSAFVDQWIASFLPIGMPALLFNAQTVNVLPVSLFGIAISAAALPDLSSAIGSAEEQATIFRERLQGDLRNIAYYVVPSSVAFILMGDAVFRLLFERGRFTPTDTLFGWTILAASSIGLLASTAGRVYAAGFYALLDTRRPVNFALLRVIASLAVGWILAIQAPRWLGIDPRWGGAGLGLAASGAGWLEFMLLRRGLERRIGRSRTGSGMLVRLLAAAAASAAVAVGVQALLGGLPAWIPDVVALAAFGATYLATTLAMRLGEAETLARRLRLRR